MRTKFLMVAMIALLAIVVGTPPLFNSSPVRAASEQDIEDAIVLGLAWLDAQQQPGGEFVSPTGSLGYHDAATCLALVKFEHRGWELYPPPRQGPFDAAYQYRQTVVDGLDYVFKLMTVDGAFVHVGGGVYKTGICMMAVAASREPDRKVTVASPVQNKTYKEVLQGMLDWMEDAQNASTDPGPPAACCWGGWGYTANDCTYCGNSNSGYATMGIGFAIFPGYKFGLAVSPAVLTELDTFIGNIQDYPLGTGCSDYRPCPSYYTGWYNTLKTGNLLYEMKLVGRQPTVDPEVDAAIQCIENDWGSTAVDVFFGYPVSWQAGAGQGYYQAMFTMMKGLEGYRITSLGAGIGDWFDKVSDYIVAEQSGAGYWSGVGFGAPDLVLETSWALLTLEKVVPVVPGVGGIVDIHVDSPDSLVASADEASPGSSVPYSLVLAGALTAGAIAVAAGTLYARRRLS